jgi:YVTN family beta-propeller protein
VLLENIQHIFISRFDDFWRHGNSTNTKLIGNQKSKLRYKMNSDKTLRNCTLLKILGVSVLTLLMLMSIADAASFAYITNFDSHSVSVIDTTTNTITDTINVGNLPYGVAVNQKGTKAYVANQGSGTVSVIDTTRNIVIATVPVGNSPIGVAITPDGTRVYVTHCLSNNVSVINAATNDVIATLSVGNYPVGVAVNPAGTKAYVANRGSNNVSIIDTKTNTITATVGVGSSPTGVAINPAGTKIYVTNFDSYSVSVIDIATNTVESTVSVGWNPEGVAVTPDGTKVYVANDLSNTVSVIETNKDTVTVHVGNSPAAFGQFIGEIPVLPVANFSASPTTGKVPLTVKFRDKSTGLPTSWFWNFGDKSTSTARNPVHKYSKAGKYTVILTVKNVAGSDTKTMLNYITVNKKWIEKQ